MKKTLVALGLMVLGSIAVASLWLIYRPSSASTPPVVYQKVLGVPQAHSPDANPPTLPLDLIFAGPSKGLIARQENGQIKLWDIATGETQSIGETEGLFAYCPARQRMLYSQNGETYLRRLHEADGRLIVKAPHSYGAWSEDCGYLALAQQEANQVEVREGGNGTLLSVAETSMPVRNGLALSRDGSALAAAIGTYSTSNGHKTGIQFFEVAQGGKLKAGANYGADFDILGLWRMIFTAGGDELVTGAQKDDRSGLRRLAATETEVVWRRDGFAAYWVRAIALSPDGEVLASGDEKGFLRLWDAKNGEKLYEGQTGLVIQSLGYSADGRHLAVGLWNSTIGIVNVGSMIEP